MGTGAGQIVDELDFDEIEEASNERPAWRLVQAAAQSLAHDTDVMLTFGTGSTVIDTHNFHDEATNNTRVTPSVPGIYVVTGVGFFEPVNNVIRLECAIALNGTIQHPRMREVHMRDSAGGANDLTSDSASRTTPRSWGMFQMNGTTDYFELMARHTRQTAASLNTTVSGFASVFEGYLLRS